MASAPHYRLPSRRATSSPGNLTCVAAAIEDPDEPGSVIGLRLPGFFPGGVYTRPFRFGSIWVKKSKKPLPKRRWNHRYLDQGGRKIRKFHTVSFRRPREYQAQACPDLGWTLSVTCSRKTLSSVDVNRQLIDNLVFIGLVALIAAAIVAAFEFSRRMSNHIQ